MQLDFLINLMYITHFGQNWTYVVYRRPSRAAVTSSTAFNAPCFTFHIVRDTSLANPWDKLETYDLETGGWVYRHRNQAFHVTLFSYWHILGIHTCMASWKFSDYFWPKPVFSWTMRLLTSKLLICPGQQITYWHPTPHFIIMAAKLLYA